MLKVLVVEDEFYVRRGTVLAIDWASLGCMVVGEAANGEEGLALARSLQPDIIITDIKMPHMDGIEMVTRLRSDGCTAAVVILTAFSDFDYARSALRLGVTDYLLKPYHDGELEAIVQKLIQGRSQGEIPAEPSLPAMDARPQDPNGYAQRAIRVIAAHYQEYGFSLNSIAEELALSEGHLSHVFKRETGYTILEYLTQYRIHKAMQLLKDGNTRIYEVAGLVGFRDVAYFSTNFKKFTGMSPKEYQEQFSRI